MSSSSELVGTIGAINTFVGNFPMGLLDVPRSGLYQSSFDLVFDILRACGVDVNQMMNIIIEGIYGAESVIGEGIDGLYLAAANLGDKYTELNSIFFDGLENSVVNILLNILTALFTCSAIPIIPNKYMDYFDNMGAIDPVTGEPIAGSLSFPVTAVDPFGYFRYRPISPIGKFYYDIEGMYLYYEKESDISAYTPSIQSQVNKYEEATSVSLGFGKGHQGYVADGGNTARDEIVFNLTSPLSKKVTFTVAYDTVNDGGAIISSSTKTATIMAGQSQSNGVVLSPTFIDKADNQKYHDRITAITATLEEYTYGPNDKLCGAVGQVNVCFPKQISEDVLHFWMVRDAGASAMENLTAWSNFGDFPKRTVEQLGETIYETVYHYEQIFNPEEEAVPVDNIPEHPTAADPTFIMWFTGITNSTLYKTGDLNAFMWYVLNRGGDTAITSEYNKLMWDNRLEAERHGLKRESSEDWNDWYNSRTELAEDRQHVWAQDYTLGTDNLSGLTPLLQFSVDEHYYTMPNIKVTFPAQTYFKPKGKPSASTITNPLIQNASLYKFNSDYLRNTRIFKPKVILYQMLNELLDGTLIGALDVVDVNLNKKLMRARLSSAIKNLIEADDIQVDDSYFQFSNDELNDMIEQTILSRYSATRTNDGEGTATVVDANEYMKQLDSISMASSAVDRTTQITRTVTEVSLDKKATGDVVNYTMSFSVNNDILNKLIWAITLPIAESLFSPQIVLLILMNFEILGVVRATDINGEDTHEIVNLVINKMFGMVKSIVLFVKDKIVEILLEFVYSILVPWLQKYVAILLQERIQAWIKVLEDALLCLALIGPRFKTRNILKTKIDNVDYADIVPEQTKPETYNRGGTRR